MKKAAVSYKMICVACQLCWVFFWGGSLNCGMSLTPLLVRLVRKEIVKHLSKVFRGFDLSFILSTKKVLGDATQLGTVLSKIDYSTTVSLSVGEQIKTGCSTIQYVKVKWLKQRHEKTEKKEKNYKNEKKKKNPTKMLVRSKLKDQNISKTSKIKKTLGSYLWPLVCREIFS